jgi:hypothetical protein
MIEGEGKRWCVSKEDGMDTTWMRGSGDRRSQGGGMQVWRKWKRDERRSVEGREVAEEKMYANVMLSSRTFNAQQKGKEGRTGKTRDARKLNGLWGRRGTRGQGNVVGMRERDEGIMERGLHKRDKVSKWMSRRGKQHREEIEYDRGKDVGG